MSDSFRTFTVSVDVFQWMKSTSEASKLMLCTYLEDVAESLDFRQAATACALHSQATLWFTFANEHDAADFRAVIDQIYNLGGWLIND